MSVSYCDNYNKVSLNRPMIGLSIHGLVQNVTSELYSYAINTTI